MKKGLLISALLSLWSTSVFAFTECPITIESIYAGDAGSIYIFYQNGGAFNIAATDPNLKNALTLATAALMAGNPMVVRFASNNAPCATGKLGDFQGLHLFKK